MRRLDHEIDQNIRLLTDQLKRGIRGRHHASLWLMHESIATLESLWYIRDGEGGQG